MALLGVFGMGFGQGRYPDHAQLSDRLKKINSQYKALTQLQSIAKTSTGKDIWLLTLSKGDAAKKPAIAIVAGVEGAHLAGIELAVQVAEKLLAATDKDSVAKVLETKTIYVIPSVNPDATAQCFSNLKYERSGNAAKTDDDRDSKLDEDGPEDLNGDGVISMMRIEDPTGTYRTHKDDPRVIVPADPTKGEQGKYMYITEGIDNDKDGKFNEDGPGGVALNKNFTFDYPSFTSGAGEYPVSEPELRGLLDFLYGSQNIHTIFTFGPSNNLTDPTKFDHAKATKRIVNGWQEKDVAVNEQVSKLYTQAGLKDAPIMAPAKGDFPQTAYYHIGRLSFSTPGWWMPKDTAKKNVTDNDDVRLLRWAKANNLNIFTEWKEVQSPDFQGKKVEVGGFTPFSKMNPPVEMLSVSADKHAKFLVSYAQLMPSVEIVNVKTEIVSVGLTRISCDIHNPGLLPSHSEIGNRVRWVDRMKIKMNTSNDQQILSGRNQQLFREAIAGNGTMSFSWLVSGAGSVTIEAGSATTGVKQVQVDLGGKK